MAAPTPFYLAFGAIGLLLNVTVAVAMSLEKEMRNATYKFMVHLAIADASLLFGLLLGPSIVLAAGYDLPADSTAGKIFAYCNGFGYHAAVLFMIAVAFSRWVHFAKRHSRETFFGGCRHTVVCVSIWVFVLAFISPFLWYPNAFALLPNSGLYTFTNSTYSYTLQTFDEVVNVVAVFLQILFNVLTSAWIVKLRKELVAPEMQAMNRKELKLFALCVIDSTVYALLIAVHYYSLYLDQSEAVGVTLEVLFLLNHVDCAFLYLCFNRELRSDIVTFVKRKVFRMSEVTVTPVSRVRAIA